MAGTGQSIANIGDAQTVAVRPLSKGMNTDIASQLLDAGAGRNVEGFIVDRLGLRGVPGFKPMLGGASTNYGKIPFAYAYEYVQHLGVFFTSAGAQELIAITNKSMYKSTDLLSFSRIPWVRANYTKTNLVGATITIGASLFLTDYVRAGQQVELVRTSNGVKELYTIQSVTDATHIVLTASPSNGPYNNNFVIYDTFTVSDPYVVQWAAGTGSLFLVDYTSGGIRRYSGSYVNLLPIHNENGAAPANPAAFTGAASIWYVGGRLVVGCTIESGSESRKTARWSSPTDLSEFSSTSVAIFKNSLGEILAIKSLENYPVFFFGRGIACGEPYMGESGDTDPWIFKELDTGGKNACSPRGITAVPNGLAYVAKNDICLINSLKRTSQGEFVVESLECPVLRESLLASDHKTSAIAFYDTYLDAAVFCFHGTAEVFSDLWYYFGKTKEWSHRGHLPYTLTAIADLSVSASTTWAQVAGQWNTIAARSWASFMQDYSVSHMTAADSSGILYVIDEAAGFDTHVNSVTYALTVYAINHVYETGDLDFGYPDDTKVVHHFALRISGERQRSQDSVFTILVSTDKGQTWKSPRTMTIGPLNSEQEIHFRASGTNIRFRISFNSTDVPFTLEEYTFRVRLAGAQVIRGSH